LSKKPVHLIILVIVLMGVLGASFNVHEVEAPYPIIYIKADGSIDPSTANITSSDNVTYTFTADINASIVVEKNNTVVDGAGYTLQGIGSGTGIDLSYRNNVTLKNVEVTNFNKGIYLLNSTNNTVTGNNASNNEDGIQLSDSTNNTVTGNTASSNGYEGIYIVTSTNNTVTGNTASNNGYYGILLWYSSNNTVAGNTASNNDGGIRLYSSSNNTISENNITDNEYYGISIEDSSSNNTISRNILVNNTNSIDIVGVLFTTISRNHIAENDQYGIILDAASNNTISANNITNNNLGIFYDGLCNNNTAYHNNFVDNANHVEVSLGDVDAWDDGFEGNYWSNYTGIDLNYDGIGDSWHEISENNTDHYPLMGMFHSFNTTLGKYVNVISNSTIDSFRYFESNSTIIMHVSNMTTNQTYGFCRIRIPHALMNETYHVTIDGAEPDYVNYTLHDDEDNRWIYCSYQHSTLEIVIIPEFPSFLIISLFMVATLLAVIAHRKKHPKMIARKKKRGVGLNPSRSL
jgi:parallel beta-helix repeat protein